MERITSYGEDARIKRARRFIVQKQSKDLVCNSTVQRVYLQKDLIPVKEVLHVVKEGSRRVGAYYRNFIIFNVGVLS